MNKKTIGIIRGENVFFFGFQLYTTQNNQNLFFCLLAMLEAVKLVLKYITRLYICKEILSKNCYWQSDLLECSRCM